MTEHPKRLVVGVTGHRKLADQSRLAAAVDAVLDEIARQAAGDAAAGQDETLLRLSVMSPLAEGADRLVAERVLARPDAELEVILPLPEDEYAVDFNTAGSRVEFAGLLARARTVHRLPLSPSREEAYAAAGRYVVDHCDVLVAIWDGLTPGGPGGTAEIVDYARSRSRRLVIVGP